MSAPVPIISETIDAINNANLATINALHIIISDLIKIKDAVAYYYDSAIALSQAALFEEESSSEKILALVNDAKLNTDNVKVITSTISLISDSNTAIINLFNIHNSTVKAALDVAKIYVEVGHIILDKAEESSKTQLLDPLISDNINIIKLAIKAVDDSIINALSLNSLAFTPTSAISTALAIMTDISTAAVYNVKLINIINSSAELRLEASTQATNINNALFSMIGAYLYAYLVVDITTFVDTDNSAVTTVSENIQPCILGLPLV